MTDELRLRSTTVVAFVLSLPTIAAFMRYEIGASTAAMRGAIAVAVAIACVAVVSAVLDRVPPLEPPPDPEAGEDALEADALGPLPPLVMADGVPGFDAVALEAAMVEDPLERAVFGDAVPAPMAVLDEPFPFLEGEDGR